MKLLRILLVLVVSMLLGFYLMAVTLVIHPFLGGVIFGITISAALYIMCSHIKQ